MADTLKTYTADNELATLLKEAARSGARLRIKTDDETYELDVKPAALTSDLWANYDPEAARRAWRAGAGVLQGVDAEELIRMLKDEREQDSSGRPAE